MAITKPDWETKTQSDRDKEADGVFEKPVLSEESIAVQELYAKLRESFDKTNEHITQMSANNAKVGITQSQADAIVANTKKTGISTAQANLITALNQGISQAIPTNQKNITAVIEPTIVIGKTASTLDFQITLSDKSVFTTSLTLTKKK